MTRSAGLSSAVVLAVAAGAAALAPGPAVASLALAKQHACIACHAVDRKLVGPAYADVAKKYAGQKDAEASVMLRIRAGGSGRWGAVPMPPQPSLSDADLKALAAWILGGAR
ncbi:MAG: c-type cytochrome [Rubrivivax sp.]